MKIVALIVFMLGAIATLVGLWMGDIRVVLGTGLLLASAIVLAHATGLIAGKTRDGVPRPWLGLSQALVSVSLGLSGLRAWFDHTPTNRVFAWAMTCAIWVVVPFAVFALRQEQRRPRQGAEGEPQPPPSS
jgi:hypothetical protein